MRLLYQTNTNEYGLTKDYRVDEPIPPYAILSHTWLANAMEPTYTDLSEGKGQEKPGYEKIRFCGEQSRRDNLSYFWIDTCCINKENKAEESHSINSMFKWYRDSAKCYVYLEDVSSSCIDTSNGHVTHSWDSEFWKSKWFSRGWTLQELLAPRIVQFFSRERVLLGDKNSLQMQLHAITAVPISALQGIRLHQFNPDDPFQWMNRRETTVAEDKVYSLLGIFDIKLSLSYGEGELKARERLWEAINMRRICIQDLCITDPWHDKKRIEENKGGLLRDSYYWILKTSEFQQWRSTWQCSLLWIKGDPGKGKTMLLCGIIDQLNTTTFNTNLLSFFFCQAIDARINNAVAILRGLLFMLIDQQPSLALYVQEKYDRVGKALFNDINAWAALSEIFIKILQDPSLKDVCLIIDALDECVTGLPELLKLIVRASSVISRVKWIVSSRNWPSIERDLETTRQKVRLSLELNEKSVSSAVVVYIKTKVDWLAQANNYDNDTRKAVEDYLLSNACGTFLWVALVCQELGGISGWEAEDRVKEFMEKEFPPGLDPLYRRMLYQLRSSRNAKLCNDILAVASVARRPITLDELTSFISLPARISGNSKALVDIIALCGSFLTLQERNVTFIHQSAKDFLVQKASNEVYPLKIEHTHYTIFSQSLQVMSRTLRRDIYNLRTPGFSIHQVEQPNPDPLSSARYSCVYWIDHLIDCNPTRETSNVLKDGTIEKFLCNTYLYWLEALSLCRSLPEGITSLANLRMLLQVTILFSSYFNIEY
jgi:hypothetical protein